MSAAVSIALTACQKEIRQEISVKEESLSESENVWVPENGDDQGLALRGGHRQECNTFYGPAVKMGNRHVRSWINISKKDKRPLALGIEFAPGSLQNLPTDPTDFAASTFILPLHEKARELTPFDHITINWEPEGHEPPGVYDVPHFDIHFYKISVVEQLAVTGVPGLPPAGGFLPASYVIQGATVPQMGTHWLDPAFPELQPPPNHSPFTHTLIYGSDNGKVIFLEPMITRDFILSGDFVRKSYPQPAQFSPAGTFYPTVYKIWKSWENRRHYVALTNFAWR